MNQKRIKLNQIKACKKQQTGNNSYSYFNNSDEEVIVMNSEGKIEWDEKIYS